MNREEAYKIFGLTSSATDEEIKRVYKKMALRYHPDKNGDSDESKKKFQDINEAFRVIMTHESGDQKTGADIFKDILREVFGEEDIFAAFIFPEEILGQIIRRPPPYRKKFSIPFDRWLDNPLFAINFKRKKWLSETDWYFEKIRLDMDMRDGMTAIFAEMGDESCDSNLAGDVILELKVNSPEGFSVEGNNLIKEIEVNLYEFIYGKKIRLRRLEEGKRRTKIKISGPMSSTVVLPSLGLPVGAIRGDLILNVKLIGCDDKRVREEIKKLSSTLLLNNDKRET